MDSPKVPMLQTLSLKLLSALGDTHLVMGDSIVSVLTKIAAVAGQSHIVGVLRNERNIYNNNFGLKVRHDIEVQLLNVKLLK